MSEKLVIEIDLSQKIADVAGVLHWLADFITTIGVNGFSGNPRRRTLRKVRPLKVIGY